MAKQMGNDDVLANGIIVLTTLLAAVTITLWIFLLRSFGLL
jgi:predicted permease